jgi:hypothetical protein
VEHEREGKNEEIEFQLKWTNKKMKQQTIHTPAVFL